MSEFLVLSGEEEDDDAEEGTREGEEDMVSEISSIGGFSGTGLAIPVPGRWAGSVLLVVVVGR